MPETTDQGGRKPRVSDSELKDVFRSASDPVLSTREVADAVPIKRRATLNRLQSLEEDGDLESKQIGGRNTVWWRRDANADETDTQAAVSGRDATASDTGRDPNTQDTAAWEREIERIDTPGTGTQREKREEALREAYRHLVLNGTAQKSDFAELLEGDDVGYASFESWWSNYVKAKDALACLPGVEAPGEGEHTWHYVDGDGGSEA